MCLRDVNPLNAELNPTCCLLALLGAYHFLHVSRIRVKSLTLRQLMSYIYMQATCFGSLEPSSGLYLNTYPNVQSKHNITKYGIIYLAF
jgi:hypothetical protein